MAATTEKIAWTCIILGLFMQIFASIWLGTGFTTAFNDLPAITGTSDLFSFVGTFVLDLLKVVFGFFNQSWAETFPAGLRYAILVLFDSSIVFLVSSNTALLVTTIIAAIVGGIISLFHP